MTLHQPATVFRQPSAARHTLDVLLCPGSQFGQQTFSRHSPMRTLIRRRGVSGSDVLDFSPSATIELPDICITQESSVLWQFLGAASRVPENIEAAVLIHRVDQSIVEDRKRPHPYIRAIAETLNNLCSRLRHEYSHLKWQ